ncbi:ABC transporter permease [Arenivirga flava]|uniref:ABC transporter permease n=1 Tax=Arenivirga flava TaxID=1930060 RepID=A0AA37USJ8_9MICO|nr:ABC transporter permease [Arenivirga flava]GMA27637.1 ABC transporter permease [Arenivirga flava]
MRTLRAEWTKAITLRSIAGAIVAALLLPPLLAVASGMAFDGGGVAGRSFPVASHGFETAGFGQPLIILVAALVTGTDYLDGQLRTTLAATPRRDGVLAAKLLAITAVALLVGLVSTGAAVVLKHSILGEHALRIDEFTPAMGWNLLGVAVNYALIGLIAASVTIIARSLIVTLVVLVPVVLGLSISLLGVVPALRFLPDLAGMQLLTAYPGVGLLDPVPGGIVMAGWAVALGVAARCCFRFRDTAG